MLADLVVEVAGDRLEDSLDPDFPNGRHACRTDLLFYVGLISLEADFLGVHLHLQLLLDLWVLGGEVHEFLHIRGRLDQQLGGGCEPGPGDPLFEGRLLYAFALPIEIQLPGADVIVRADPPANRHIVLLGRNRRCVCPRKLVDDCRKSHFSEVRLQEGSVYQCLGRVSQGGEVQVFRQGVAACAQHIRV